MLNNWGYPYRDARTWYPYDDYRDLELELYDDCTNAVNPYKAAQELIRS